MVINKSVTDALAVLTRNPITRAFLTVNDPKALEQARKALADAGVNPDPAGAGDEDLVDGFNGKIATNGEATLAEVLYRYPAILGMMLTLKSTQTPADWRACAARLLGEFESKIANGKIR